MHDRNVPRKHATLHASSLLAHSRSCCVVCGRRCGQPQPLWRTRARSRSHMHIWRVSLGRRLGGALSGVRAARHAAIAHHSRTITRQPLGSQLHKRRVRKRSPNRQSGAAVASTAARSQGRFEPVAVHFFRAVADTTIVNNE